MVSKQDGESNNGVLTGVIALLVLTVILLTGAAIYCYRMAEKARLTADQATMAAAESRKSEQVAQYSMAKAEQSRDTMMFSLQYLKHQVGAETLTDAELNVVRPTIMGDPEMAEMDAVLRTFEADMASVNQFLGPNRQVHNYHEAVVACRELLDKDAN